MRREGVSLPHMEAYKTGEITLPEAYLASQRLDLRQVVVSHHMVPEYRDVKEFLEIARRFDRGEGLAPRVTVMRPGATIRLD